VFIGDVGISLMNMSTKNKHAVALGKLGGAAGTGASKIRRRTKAQSRQMALKGWETRRRKIDLLKRLLFKELILKDRALRKEHYGED